MTLEHRIDWRTGRVDAYNLSYCQNHLVGYRMIPHNPSTWSQKPTWQPLGRICSRIRSSRCAVRFCWPRYSPIMTLNLPVYHNKRSVTCMTRRGTLTTTYQPVDLGCFRQHLVKSRNRGQKYDSIEIILKKGGPSRYFSRSNINKLKERSTESSPRYCRLSQAAFNEGVGDKTH